MNETLLRAIEIYATRPSDEFISFLNNISKPTLMSLFTDLLTFYMNDKNSSKLRELVTALVSGYEFSTQKLGYNGYKTIAPEGTKVYCEIKPKNTDDCKRKKLNGGGTFNDYTPERFKEDIEENPNVVVSGFVEGKLIFVLEFPFTCLKRRLESELKRKFGDKMERRLGEYLRSASFSFIHYKGCKELRVIYINPQLRNFKNCITRDLYIFLEKVANEKA